MVERYIKVVPEERVKFLALIPIFKRCIHRFFVLFLENLLVFPEVGCPFSHDYLILELGSS